VKETRTSGEKRRTDGVTNEQKIRQAKAIIDDTSDGKKNQDGRKILCPVILLLVLLLPLALSDLFRVSAPPYNHQYSQHLL